MPSLQRLVATVVACLTIAAGVGACATPTTLVQSTDVAALASARTYVVESPAGVSSDEGVRVSHRISEEIGQILDARGFRATASEADLKVSFRVVPGGRRAREEPEKARIGARTAVGPGDPFEAYTPFNDAEGDQRIRVLLLAITDNRSGAIVWQTTTECDVTSTASALSQAGRATRAALSKVPRSGGGPR